METRSAMEKSEECSRLRFVARQPIFDEHNHIHGYELLYRQGPENCFSGDHERASRITLDSTLLFGTSTLTGKSKAFVNCTREVLLEKAVTILPPQSTVLEVLEFIEPEPDVIQACRDLKMMGYKIALDDFVLRPGMEKLVAVADYIKVDFLTTPKEAREKIHAQVDTAHTYLLAEKIETIEDFEEARREGYTLFQGYYFCRPIMMSTSEIPPNKMNYLALLRAMRSSPLNLLEVEEVVKREPSLCFRLLRLVNSAMFGLRSEVTSVMTALMTIGEKQFRKLVSIAIASELVDGGPVEILSTALTRGRFCELCATAIQEDPTEQYLLGLFSLLPTVLHLPMEEFLLLLPLRNEVAQALEGKQNRTRRLLTCLEQYEQGNWNECNRACGKLGLHESDIAANYTQAVLWAEDALKHCN